MDPLTGTLVLLVIVVLAYFGYTYWKQQRHTGAFHGSGSDSCPCGCGSHCTCSPSCRCRRGGSCSRS